MNDQALPVRWAYALNQWDTNIDDFVRHRDHERAFKTISISGFRGVEFASSNFGAWEPFGNPRQIEAHYGSARELLAVLRDCALDAVSSWTFDPEIGFGVQMGPGPDPLDPGALSTIVETAEWFADALVELGGSILVVRPVGSAWRVGHISDDQMQDLAETWNAVGRATLNRGVRVAVHIDFLSALRLADGLERFLAATDAGVVGVALDTAEFAIAGIDPIDFYRRHADRVWHVQFKDAREHVAEAEAITPHADQVVLIAGGDREIQRWFYEPSDEPGLVDFIELARELVSHDYAGWIVVESDQSPHPAESAMVSGWYVQNVLMPLFERRGATGSF